MIRALIPRPHHIEIIHEEVPTPAPGEALLRVRSVGICGSDLHTYEGHHPYVTYPVWPGHEVSAEVAAVGSEADSGWIGRRVVLEPGIPGTGRPKFDPGRYNIATELKVMGFQAPGAMAEWFVVPIQHLHPLPDGLSHTQGACVEPAAVAVHGVQRAGVVAGREVAVVGAGTIGLLTAMVATAYGAAEVTVIEPDSHRRRLAGSMGLHAVPQVAAGSQDIVFECVGNEPAMRAAMQACRKGATMVVLGVFGSEVTLPLGLVQDWELEFKGSLMYTGDDFREAIRLLHSGRVQTDLLVTHRFPLADVEQAFTTALQRGHVLKVMLDV